MNKKSIITLFKESLKNKNTYIPNLLTASRLVGAFVIPGLFLSGNIPGAVIATAAALLRNATKRISFINYYFIRIRCY